MFCFFCRKPSPLCTCPEPLFLHSRNTKACAPPPPAVLRALLGRACHRLWLFACTPTASYPYTPHLFMNVPTTVFVARPATIPCCRYLNRVQPLLPHRLVHSLLPTCEVVMGSTIARYQQHLQAAARRAPWSASRHLHPRCNMS